MKKVVVRGLAVAYAVAAMGCGAGGEQFVGKWDCNGSEGLGFTIRHSDGANYIADDIRMFGGKLKGVTSALTFKDGMLYGSIMGQPQAFVIDKNTGQLNGWHCKLTKAKQ